MRGVLPSLVSLLLAASLPACGDDGGDPLPPRPTITLGETQQVAPSTTLPDEFVSQPAHNNLDVIRHQGALFLAVRTAPTHFASPDTWLYIVSSEDDGASWRFEAGFNRGKDLREPRFLSVGDELFMYFAELGDDFADFAPGAMYMTQRMAPGAWSEEEKLYVDGFIPWRARVVDGTAILIGYTGGENIYDANGVPLKIHLLKTTDGRSFEPVVPNQAIVLEGGGSETDFAVHTDGALVTVVRNEAGDESGLGSKICRAEAGDWGRWRCKWDPRKYDSPLVFAHAGRVWLIGRRNVTESGAFDLEKPGLRLEQEAIQYALDYWQHPKRCSLWEVHPTKLTVEWVLDLPSGGDTCFPSIVPAGADAYDVYNYSSPIESSADTAWQDGQVGPTNIYRTRLSFGAP